MTKLLETTKKFPNTEIWNDSCSCNELEYAIENGATGATTNPVIVGNVLKNELPLWEQDIIAEIANNPSHTEDEIAWTIIEKLGLKASKLLMKQFKESNGQKGRISFQTNAKYFKNTKKMIEHGKELALICENSQIKAPASKEGIEAYEEMTYEGISINATVSFTVAQAIKTAEAVERGLKRREAEGKDITSMHPVCTLMAGRLDDHIKKYCDDQGILIEPEVLEWAGVAVVKEALKIFKERGYRTTLLVAAFRNVYHWNAFIGDDIVLTIPYNWQKKINSSKFEVKDNSELQVKEKYLNDLLEINEFKKAYYEDGLSLEEFEQYGPFQFAMNQFLMGYDSLVQLIRNYII